MSQVNLEASRAQHYVANVHSDSKHFLLAGWQKVLPRGCWQGSLPRLGSGLCQFDSQFACDLRLKPLAVTLASCTAGRAPGKYDAVAGSCTMIRLKFSPIFMHSFVHLDLIHTPACVDEQMARAEFRNLDDGLKALVPLL